MKKPIPVAAPETPEWHAARSQTIGASEMAAACGLSPYQTPLELYLRKRGEIPPIEDNDAMRLGRLLEPVVKAEFIRSSGITLADTHPPMFRHPEHERLSATPDGIIDALTLFEAKTASWRMKGEWGDESTDDVPTQYLVQTQAQMSVMGANLVHLAVLFDGAVLKTFKVLRNDDLILLLTSAALELLERIKNGDPPEPNWEHKSTPDLIRVMHSTVNDVRVMLSNEAVSARIEYERLGKIAKEAEEAQKKLRAIYENEIGDNFAGVLPDGRMIRRKWIEPGHRSFDVEGRWDYKAVKFDGGPIQNLLTERATV